MDLNQTLMNAFQVEHLEHLERIRSMLLVLERQPCPAQARNSRKPSAALTA